MYRTAAVTATDPAPVVFVLRLTVDDPTRLKSQLGWLSSLTSSTVILLPELIPHLTSTLSPSKLPALFVARIDITSYDPLVKLGPGYVSKRCDSLRVKVILDEGETARGSAGV